MGKNSKDKDHDVSAMALASEKDRELRLMALEGAIDNSNDFIAIEDHNFRYIAFNHAYKNEFKRAFGVDIEIGMTMVKALAAFPEDQKKAIELWGRALKGEKFIVTQEFGDETQGIRSYYELSFNPIFDRGGKIIAASHIVRNVSYQKKVENDLRLLNEQLEQRIWERAQELVRERELLQTIIDTIPVMIAIYDPKLRQVKVNGEVEKVIGWTNEDFNHINVMEAVYPDPQYREEIAQYMQSLTPGWRDITMTAKDGSKIETSWANKRLPDGRQVGIGLDIRERKKAEDALKASERKYRELIEAANSIVIRWDNQGKIRFINEFGLQFFGYSAEELIGHNIMMIVPRVEKSTGRDPDTLVKSILEHPENHTYVPSENIRKDGETVWVAWTNKAILDEKGNVAEMLAIGNDITDLKKTQQRLETSNRELEQFAYVASHDLQEPLRMVASYTELFERRYRGQLDERAQGYMKYIIEGAARMQQLIRDLLTFSRVGRLDIECRGMDSNFVIEKVIAGMENTIRQTNAVVSYDKLPVLRANETNFTQVFQNLISNGIKFRRQDEPPRIHISAHRVKDAWLFSVKDNGIGIDPAYFNKIFVIFQRLHSREEYPGTGIGLAICKKIVETYGGKIWVESQPGQGSTFYFTIPL